MQRMETTADRLRRFRTLRGIDSGAELARLAGLPEATYRAYESGRRPLTARAARELARPLGITWQELLFGEAESAEAIATLEQASVALGQRVSRKPRPPPAPERVPFIAERIRMAGDSWALLPVYDACAPPGAGEQLDPEAALYRIAFREEWVRAVTAAPLDQLAVIRVQGDAMEPTLRPGDSVLVDCAQNRPQRTDGLYVIRTDGGLQVKRLQVEVVQGRLTILSDNKAYEVQRGVRPEDVTVVGRVIWLGRQLGS